MANKQTLKIIRGGKISPNCTLRFKSAVATKTRLMGVIAIKVHWLTNENKNFIQWFLLDAEEHGIYDYISIVTNKENEIDLYTDKFMGSLGGKKVELNKTEVAHLVKIYAKMNYRFSKTLPSPSFEYKFLLKEKCELDIYEKELLTNKIYENIETPIQLINFFLMRVVGNDEPGKKYLLLDKSYKSINSFKLIDKASILLHNKVYLVRKLINTNIYLAKSIIDTEDGYIKTVTLIEVKKVDEEFRVIRAKVIDKLNVHFDDISKEIRYPEHLLIFRFEYNCYNNSKLENELTKLKPRLLRYEFPNGTMFVEFRSHNNHVKKRSYHLGADILAIYYISKFGEFIICYYNKKDLPTVEEVSNNSSLRDMLILNIATTTDESLIYQYAQDYDKDFLSYLKETTNSQVNM